MEIQTHILNLPLRNAFRIARARTQPFENVLLRIEHDGIIGWGEASPNPFYGENAEDVSARLRGIAGWLQGRVVQTVGDIEQAWAEVWPLLKPSRAAQCALDLALWDWVARKLGKSVALLVHDTPPRPVPSFATIGLGNPQDLDAKLAELTGFPRIKIKSDSAADVEPVRRARCLDAEVAVDANCAWQANQLPALTRAFADAGTCFIEQPLPPEANSLLRRGDYALPVFADESCVSEADLPSLQAHFDGINVKLVKCGGLTPALRMLRSARSAGLRTMVGCMIETSILIAAGCVAAQIAEYADLDGAWLLGNDPATGWRWSSGVLHPPSGPGLGAEPHAL